MGASEDELDRLGLKGRAKTGKQGKRTADELMDEQLEKATNQMQLLYGKKLGS